MNAHTHPDSEAATALPSPDQIDLDSVKVEAITPTPASS